MQRSIYLIILIAGLGLVALVERNSRVGLQSELAAYRTESAAATGMTVHRVGLTFDEIYRALRTVARLPGVRSIDWNCRSGPMDRDGTMLDSNTRLTVQEIYNTLASDIAVSELYIVPVDLDPDGTDPKQTRPREPITTFDEFIVGRNAVGQAMGRDTDLSDDEGEIEEIEIFEYRQMRTQLDWMLEHCPNEKSIDALNYPLLGGSQVVTCDNSRFNPKTPNDDDRSGLVLSVPIYDQSGALRGCVSGIILSQALSDLLKTGHYAILNTSYSFDAAPRTHSQWEVSQAAGIGSAPDDRLLYSEVRTIPTADRGGTWILWAGQPDELYWSRSGVLATLNARNLGLIAVLILMLVAVVGTMFVSRAHRGLGEANAGLEQIIADRNAALDRERIASAELACQKFALDQHAIISITDIRGIITHANDVFCEISGYSREELIGQNHRIVKSEAHPPEFYRNLWKTIAGGRVWSGEIKNRAKDGSHYWVDATIVPFKDTGGKITQYVAIRTDITQRKQSEEELIQVNDSLEYETLRANEMATRAELASQSKSEFLANMSHEIRTPMTAILGYTETLLDPNLSESEKLSAVHTVRRNGDHLLQIINDILDISKIEAGKLDVERIPCSPVQVVSEVQSLMQVRADAKKLSFRIEFAGAVPETIESDPTRLKQILVNLVGNAIKFTETGVVRLITRVVGTHDGQSPPYTDGENAGTAKLRHIEIKDKEGGTGDRDGIIMEDGTKKGSSVQHSMMQFDVLDTGLGMTGKQIGMLFQAFSQADSSTTRKFGGTGLGLMISKRLSEMLGGDITVESRPGEGSLFRLMVTTGSLEGVRMLDDPATAAIAQPEAATVGGAVAKLDCRILMAEDGPDNQRLIGHILKKAGADVTIVENGKLAVDAALAARDSGSPFDVILMDMQMPVMDGYEATGQLRRKGYIGPIIALTAHAMASDRQKCLDSGCDDYATKPIDRKKLIEKIRSHLSHGDTVKVSEGKAAQSLVRG